jgi:geranylgeranyl diphosphate synthase type I
MEEDLPRQFLDDLTRVSRMTALAQGGVVLDNPRSVLAHLPNLCCQAAGGSWPDVQSVQLAWARLYDASRLIDQVQDDDALDFDSRSLVLNSAVAIFFESAESIGRLTPDVQLGLFAQLRQVVTGQWEDSIKTRPTVEEAIRVAELKTGAFLGLGCWLGATAAHAQTATCDALREFGRALGVLLQIHDDLEWLEGLGSGQEWRQERFSNIILAHAWHGMSTAQQTGLESTMRRGASADDPDIARQVREDLIQLGGRYAGVLLGVQFRARAAAALSRADLRETEASQALKALPLALVHSFRLPG